VATANEALRQLTRELDDELPRSGARLVQMLSRAEFPASHVRRCEGPHGRAAWLIQTKPAEHLRQAFELAPEVLVLLIPGDEAQARDIEKAERALSDNLRLDTGVVLVFVNDPAAPDRLAHAGRRTGRQYLFIELEQALAARDPQTWLRDELRRQLGLADLFAPGPPVVGWDFIGRAHERKRLQGYLQAGKPVGLYGLRKIGKSSLALRTLAQLVRDRGVLGLHLDMQALGPRDRNLAGFMRALVRALAGAMSKSGVEAAQLGLGPDFGSARWIRGLAAEQAEQLGFDALEAAIDWAEEEAARSVVVFIDEYERFFDSGLFPADDAQVVFDYLRGLVQTHPGRFNFMLAGLSRQYATQPRLGAQQNPLFGFLVDFPLAGFELDELSQMLRKIGRRLSLKFDADACAFIWEQTGGHPALAREYGRLVDKHVSTEERRYTAQISRQRLLDVYDEFRLHVETTMQELHVAAKTVDERAPEALAVIANHPGRSLDLPDQSVEQLRRLGMIAPHDGGWTLAMETFARWLRENVAPVSVTEA
jgi:uncharacterized protein YktA (UPF0223 family)